MKIQDYFSALERQLRQNSAIALIQQPVILLASDDYNGLIRCRAIFWDKSFLDIHETVSTEPGYPVRLQYAYTFVQNGKRIFRYDNSPHHPEIITHPNHKHIGEQDRLAPADQPGLGQIFDEIAVWLEEQ